MRDILVTVIVFGSLPFILRSPYIGVLMWSWIGYMSPHRLCWGFAYGFPFAQVVAIALLLSVLVTRDRKAIPMTPLTVVWILYVIWMCITTAFAIFPDSAFSQLDKVLKIQLMTFVTVAIMYDRRKIQLLVVVMALSIAFYGAKGGWFTLRTGGGQHVYGPGGSFIEDNNALAVALLITLPFLFYMRSMYEKTWIRFGLLVVVALCILSIAGSQSRGALVGGVCMAGFLWLKTRSKIVSGIVIVAMFAGILAFMPDSWHERMGTIETYQEDGSARGRINAWHYAVNLANDRLMGGGFNSWSRSTFAKWAPKPDGVHAAHSIYFGTLGDHGWFGLALWLTIIFLTWRNTAWILKATKGRADLLWLHDLARAIQVSFAGYLTAGAFQSLQYYDMVWHIIAITILGRHLVEEQLARDESATAVGENPEARATFHTVSIRR